MSSSNAQVIELSDDEIEEIPIRMSRMEMLNCLPNIATQIFITENISRRYIPRGVRPKRSYRYDSRRLRNIHETDRTLRKKSEVPKEGSTNGSQINICDNDFANQGSALVPHQQYQRFNHPPRYNRPNNYYPRNFSGSYFPNPLMVNLSAGVCMQQMSVDASGWQNSQGMMTATRWAPFQMNMFRNAMLMGFPKRNMSMQNAYNSNYHQPVSFPMLQQNNRPHRHLERPWRGSYSPRSRGSFQHGPSTSRQTSSSSCSAQTSMQRQSREEVYQSAFTKLPGTSSWLELKQKWRDAKTITIEDEECGNLDINDIQVLDQTLQPLNGPKNSRTIPEIYERLRIIKSAPDRTVRRKKSDFKISYNVYSSTQHYRKANPGLPMCHLIVTRSVSRCNDIIKQSLHNTITNLPFSFQS